MRVPYTYLQHWAVLEAKRCHTMVWPQGCETSPCQQPVRAIMRLWGCLAALCSVYFQACFLYSFWFSWEVSRLSPLLRLHLELRGPVIWFCTENPKPSTSVLSLWPLLPPTKPTIHNPFHPKVVLGREGGGGWTFNQKPWNMGSFSLMICNKKKSPSE
jgi:hypothetical protein